MAISDLQGMGEKAEDDFNLDFILVESKMWVLCSGDQTNIKGTGEAKASNIWRAKCCAS